MYCTQNEIEAHWKQSGVLAEGWILEKEPNSDSDSLNMYVRFEGETPS